MFRFCCVLYYSHKNWYLESFYYSSLITTSNSWQCTRENKLIDQLSTVIDSRIFSFPSAKLIENCHGAFTRCYLLNIFWWVSMLKYFLILSLRAEWTMILFRFRLTFHHHPVGRAPNCIDLSSAVWRGSARRSIRNTGCYSQSNR